MNEDPAEAIADFLDTRDQAESMMLNFIRGKIDGPFTLSIERNEYEWAVSIVFSEDGSTANGTGCSFSAAMKAAMEAPAGDSPKRPELRVVTGGKGL